MNKKHILLVDDDRSLTEVLSLRLQTRNYRISVAKDGKEALKKARGKPDLILLDILLPDISGYEVCHKLREDNVTRAVPIIILSGQDKPQDKIEGLYIGADDYITKPFDTEELFARIEAVLRRSQVFGRTRGQEKAKAINEIKRIIREDAIVPHFQPIFYLKPRKLLGFEVLSRPPENSYFANAENLFDTAFHTGMLFDVEMSAHKKALPLLRDYAQKNLVFLNVNPYIIQDEKFKNFTSFYKLYTSPRNIVLELSERTAIKDFTIFFQALKCFKQEGFNIAIDDIGSGYASLNSIVEIKPDFIKIDIHLVRNINQDPVRQDLIKALATFCKQAKVTAIAEGIEKEEELNALLDCGIAVGQGYLLGRPSAQIKDFI